MRLRRAGSLIVTVLVAAGLVAAVIAALPPRALPLAPSDGDPREVVGSIHVHTSRSDGTGTVEEVAAAAAAAGLQFVIFTDHGDATRPPDPPRYRSGVLCLDGVEISTSGGHYVAVGLRRAARYRLAGEPRDVVEDVARLGGFGIVAHPDSSKPDLRWREWGAPFDGFEWLNTDSEWRDESRLAIARAMLAYFFRPPETIASLFDRPAALDRWDALTRRRRVIGVAGHDAHARIGLGGNWEPGAEAYSLRLPSYRAAFQAFTQHVRLPRPLTGNPTYDADLLLRGLRAGHTYTVIDALASPGRLTFTATSPKASGVMGDDVVADDAVELRAEVPDVPGVSLVLIRDGRVVTTADGPVLTYTHQPAAGRPPPAVYRVEAHLSAVHAAWRVPWMLGNPIWIGPAIDRTPVKVELPPARAVRVLARGKHPVDAWTVEREEESQLSLDSPSRGVVILRYRLADGSRRGQYVAAVLNFVPGTLEGWDRLRFRASASTEMRLSVQVREPHQARRWARSVVVGPADREIVVRLDDMASVEPELSGRPPRADLSSLLFVIDTTNTLPGTQGTVEVGELQVEREASRLR